MKQRKIKSCIAAAMAFMCFGSISAQFEINAYADSSHTVTVTTVMVPHRQIRQYKLPMVRSH